MAPGLASRVVTPLLLLFGTFGFGILPIALRRTLLTCNCVSSTCKTSCRARKGKVVTSFLIYLGGGVLLATCLIHLLPEAREGFEAHDKLVEKEKERLTLLLNTTEEPHLNETEDDDGGHDHEHFPMPEFVACCGFFIVYFIEELLHFFLGGHHHIPITTETRAIRSLSRSNSCASPGDCEKRTSKEDEEIPNISYEDAVVSTDKLSKEKDNLGFLSGLMTVAALSFHSLFEGFAIGFQKSDKAIWIMFSAVSVHKFVIAFVVGLEALASGGRERLVVIYMTVFALMSPLGMVIAIITEQKLEDSSPLTVGVLNAIATGTLLYVTFCEILQREEEHNNLQGWQQFLATLTGFGIMCIVQYGSTFA